MSDVTLSWLRRDSITEDIARQFIPQIVWDGMPDFMRTKCCDIIWDILCRYNKSEAMTTLPETEPLTPLPGVLPRPLRRPPTHPNHRPRRTQGA